MQQQVLAPKYTREFQCTGPKCPDNCCHSWNVTLDPSTYRMYRTDPKLIPVVQEALADNRDHASKANSPGYLRLDHKTGKCLLQEESGLCTLQKRFGENALSQTCALYPRKIVGLGSDHLMTLSDSCPEAARMLIEDPDALELEFGPLQLPDRFNLNERENPEENNYQDRYLLLQGLLTILRHRDISLEMRLFICTLLIQRADKLLAEKETSEMTMQEVVELFFDLIQKNYFVQQAEQLKNQGDGALGLVILKSLVKERRKATPFTEEVAKCLMGLGIKDKTKMSDEHLQNLDSARFIYLTPLENQHPHFLENLVVNWLLNDIFPLHKNKLADGWLKITTRYLLLRTLLSGVGAFQKKLDLKDVNRIAYRFGRSINHSNIVDKLQLNLVGKNLHQVTAFVRALDL